MFDKTNDYLLNGWIWHLIATIVIHIFSSASITTPVEEIVLSPLIDDILIGLWTRKYLFVLGQWSH